MSTSFMLVECNAYFWLKIAHQIETELGYKLSYWIAWDRIRDDVVGQFSGAIFHDTYDAKKNIPPKGLEHFLYSTFDEDAQSVWISEAQLIFDMLNRFDHSRDFSFIERQQWFYEALVYWNGILEENKPAFVVFPCPPHGGFDYLIFALCRQKKIQTIMFDEVALLPPYCLSFCDYDLPHSQIELNLSKQKTNDSKLSPGTKLCLEKIMASYDEAKPIREVLAHQNLRKRLPKEKRKEIKEVLKALLKEIRSYVMKRTDKPPLDVSGVIKQRDVDLRSSFKQNFCETAFLYQLFKERNLTEKRFDYYHKLCIEPNLSQKYVYLSLAGQPERTSNPQGSIFTYQILIINILSNALLPGWKLYVKEHPNQFHPYMYVNMYRDEYYYSSISSIPNVDLIRTNYNPFELIDSAQAVATICGTTGIEAVLRGKPAFVFGEAWYKHCPGVFRVKNFSDAKAAVEKIISGFQVSVDKVKQFFSVIENHTFKGLGDPIPDWYGLSEEENVINIVKEINKHLQNNEEINYAIR